MTILGLKVEDKMEDIDRIRKLFRRSQTMKNAQEEEDAVNIEY